MPLQRGTQFGLFHDNVETNAMWNAFEKEILAAQKTSDKKPYCKELRQKHVNKTVLELNDFYVQGGGCPHFGGSTSEESNIRVVFALYNKVFEFGHENQYWFFSERRQAVIPV